MDHPDIPLHSEAPVSTDITLQQQVRALRGTVMMLLIASCCLGAGVSIYLYRQVTSLNLQVIEAKRVLIDYQSNALPRIQWFVNNLKEFGKTNSDFNPILSKYGLTNSSVASGAPASTKK
jgi:hypothetical protein